MGILVLVGEETQIGLLKINDIMATWESQPKHNS